MHRNRKEENTLKILKCLILFYVISIIFFLIYVWLYNSNRIEKLYTYKELTIEKGQTLWNVAKDELNNNSYYDQEDIRQIIFEIKKDNEMQRSDTFEGQILKIRILEEV